MVAPLKSAYGMIVRRAVRLRQLSLLVSQKLLAAVRNIADDVLVFQRDSAPVDGLLMKRRYTSDLISDHQPALTLFRWSALSRGDHAVTYRARQKSLPALKRI